METPVGTVLELRSRRLHILYLQDGAAHLFATIPRFERLSAGRSADIEQYYESDGIFELDGYSYQVTNDGFRVRKLQSYDGCVSASRVSRVLVGMQGIQIASHGSSENFEPETVKISCFEREMVLSCTAPPKCSQITFRSSADAWEAFQLLRFAKFAYSSVAKQFFPFCEPCARFKKPAVILEHTSGECLDLKLYRIATQIPASETRQPSYLAQIDQAAQTETDDLKRSTYASEPYDSSTNVGRKQPTSESHDSAVQTQGQPAELQFRPVVQLTSNQNSFDTAGTSARSFRSPEERASYEKYANEYRKYQEAQYDDALRDIQLAQYFIRESPQRIAIIEAHAAQARHSPPTPASALLLSHNDPPNSGAKDPGSIFQTALSAVAWQAYAATASIERSAPLPRCTTESEYYHQIGADVAKAVEKCSAYASNFQPTMQLHYPITSPSEPASQLRSQPTQCVPKSSGCNEEAESVLEQLVEDLSGIESTSESHEEKSQEMRNCVPKRHQDKPQGKSKPRWWAKREAK